MREYHPSSSGTSFLELADDLETIFDLLEEQEPSDEGKRTFSEFMEASHDVFGPLLVDKLPSSELDTFARTIPGKATCISFIQTSFYITKSQ
jgi:hypothetical protein